VTDRQARPEVLALLVAVVALVAASAFQLAQGPAGVSLGDLAAWLGGSASPDVAAVVEGSRLPRWTAGLLAGAALGMAGTLFQAATRNPMAEPGLLGVGAGAQVAVATVALTGWELSGTPRGFVALVGGLAAAALTFAVASSSGAGPARLILAGVSVGLLCSAVTATLQLVDEQATAGLFFWGQGSLAQLGTSRVWSGVPFVAAGGVAALLLARRLDLLALGNERAGSLGISPTRARLAATGAAVALTAGAVAVTGPIVFVGLLAPHAARALGARSNRWCLPTSAVLGAALVLAADGVARTVPTFQSMGELPVGVLTALVGAPFLFLLARRSVSGAPPRDAGRFAGGRVPFPIALGGAVALLGVGLVALLTVGDTPVTLGQALAALGGGGDAATRAIVVDGRLPRALVAAAAGASLAVAGCLLQGVTRNPLAAPSTMGLVAGSSVGALGLVLLVPGAPVEALPLAAFAGGLVAVAVVLVLARGLDPIRLVLLGVAMTAFGTAIANLLVVGNELRLAQALTWLSGSTYGRTWGDLWLVLPFLVVLVPVAWVAGRHADLLSVGDDTASALGVATGRSRAVLLGAATLLAAAAVAAVGAIAFVGLIAPQVARLVAGPRHRRSILLSACVGALLLVAADAVGRTVIAPREIPSGLVVALLGAPVFVALLWATRRSVPTER
jgi:ABC-type Fe3+-siderophore transport system permease subunit